MILDRESQISHNDLAKADNEFSKDAIFRSQTSQQERLKYLENYRLICEKRIREIAPSHPLPVLPSHCGQPNPDLEELKQKLKMSVYDSGNSNQGGDAIRLRDHINAL